MLLILAALCCVQGWQVLAKNREWLRLFYLLPWLPVLLQLGPSLWGMAVTRGGSWSEETLVWQLGAGLRAASCSFPHPFLLLTLLGI